MKNRLFRVFLIITLSLVIFSASVYAQPIQEFDIVKAKHDLMTKYPNLANDLQSFTSEEIDQKLAMLVAHQEDQMVIDSIMEDHGVYRLHIPEKEEREHIVPMASNADITMNKPTIYWDSGSLQWIIVGGGHWKNDSWKDHCKTLNYYVGEPDAFGVSFVDTKGERPTLNSVYAYMSDGAGNEVNTTNRTDGNARNGFGFRLQDYWLYDVNMVPRYVGKYFAGLARYNATFASYHGWASSYYIHTWDKAIIKRLTLGVSGTSGNFQVEITNQQFSFPAWSGGETSF